MYGKAVGSAIGAVKAKKPAPPSPGGRTPGVTPPKAKAQMPAARIAKRKRV